ncbi:ankyrin repeat-containing domain protein [Lophiotrema nucula]|uniref:Ankyrin repeat-containing domain protein n=1 Tax=Lophiotrema nucula TaxID=690887 RepID=A0A6A5ZAZ8_9PLEO|nr:ankyrin repeat-containing domain protein [Lophiotrema nucula]
MKARRSLSELILDAGIQPVPVRQPCLPPPSQPAIIASEEDHALARTLLVEQRRSDPDFKDPSKQLKRIFKSSKEKEKLQDTNTWEFSQDEIDRALSAVIDKPTTSPGLVQAFLALGAKVNYVETPDEKKAKGSKKPNASARRRSTVLQRAATQRRADSVSLLASSGADQTTLDEGLKAALATKDHSSIQELLRHGANPGAYPNALADAVRSGDQNLVRLLLRAPKALQTEIISSCLPAAVQQKSESIISLLTSFGANPNFNEASALKMAITFREYRLAVVLVAGPLALTEQSLQHALDAALKVPTAQQLYQFLQLLFGCGLSPTSPGLSGLLIAATKRNDTPLAQLLVEYGVSTNVNEAECLRNAISNSNWVLADTILDTSVTPAHASVALTVMPANAPRPERLRLIASLLQKGATGPPLGRWLLRAVEEGDTPLMDLLVNAGAPLGSGNSTAIQAAVVRKDTSSLRKLLNGRPPPQALAQAFPLLRHGYSPRERLETVRLLLTHGAHGPEVNQALIDAVADTSASRDMALIEELVQRADVNFDFGKALQLAVIQANLRVIRLLLHFKPSLQTTLSALPLAFGPDRKRHTSTMQIVESLLANGIERASALQTLQIAIADGPENLDVIQRLLTTDRGLLPHAFQTTIKLSNEQKKAPIMACLLKMGIDQPTLDEALVTETQHVVHGNGTSILRLLVQHGASVNFQDGKSLSMAATLRDAKLIDILLSGKERPSRATATHAFRTLFHGSENEPVSGNSKGALYIAKQLLAIGVDQHTVDSALRMVLDDSNPVEYSRELVDLLLDYHADVNVADGTCFVFATRRQDFEVLNKLFARSPDFSVVIPSLLKFHLDEGVVVRALQACFDHGCTSDSIEGPGPFRKPALALALQQYPRSERLMNVLLHSGCNPNTVTPEVLDPRTGTENIPVLLWALAQPRRTVSSPVVLALLDAGASPTLAAPVSEITPIALAAREARSDIVSELLKRGADPSVRDKWNRSPLFYASSTSMLSIVELLAPHALKDDGSLHEAARCHQLDTARILVSCGHSANFPSRLHNGRHALGELCLNADLTSGTQRTKLRQLIRLFLDKGSNAKFKARNERSVVILALDNPHSALGVTDALLETEVWENLNDEKHMFRDEKGLWYSPIKYAELVPSHARARCKQELIELLRDKGCEEKYYSEYAEQPEGAIGMPQHIKQLADRQKEHLLSLKLTKEANEHARMLEEAAHRDSLRRKQEKQDADMAAAAAQQAHWQNLEQQKHEFEIQRVRSAERMKRNEKVAWHNLLTTQEQDMAAQRQQIEDRKASASYANEQRLIGARKAELEHRAGVERQSLMEKEQLYERNVQRQKMITDRLDESAQLHARLRQDRPAIEGTPNWGSVD